MLGMVVLIDCWATWCAPCIAKMLQLKALYEHRHADGSEVIGVNFDKDRTKAEQRVKTLAMPWPEVFVPSDDRTRRLWDDATGSQTLPRLLLIDREGILRGDGGPDELEKRAAALLDAPRPSR
jgi:thiol-disulfide isomerase/thioredoxin